MKFFSNRPLITIIKHSLPCSFTSMYRNRLFEFPETCALHIQQPSDPSSTYPDAISSMFLEKKTRFKTIKQAGRAGDYYCAKEN